MTFTYTDGDLIYESHWDIKDTKSRFDRELQQKWKLRLENGVFRYRLLINESKILPGKYQFLAQLNTDRATNRRAPEDITSLNQPFNKNKFNFTNVTEREILFKLSKTDSGDQNTNYLVINVSPLEFGHSLLLPSLHDCLPQIATAKSIRLAIEVVLLSSTPTIRVGFNSLCGFASVNHLHYHVYYLKYKMLLQNVKVLHLSGPCHELLDYPAPCFAFQLSGDRNVTRLTRSVHILTEMFQAANVAHNLYITRGSTFEDPTATSCQTVRVYVWARKSSTGAKESAGFNPALCELFGHLNVKEENFYQQLQEDQVAAILCEICSDSFNANRNHVITLFQGK